MFSKLTLYLLETFIPLITLISPSLSVKIMYKLCFKKSLNLREPQTLNEKIQWLKLNIYNKDILVKQCADKYTVRKYVTTCGCDEILNNLYAVYNNVDDIEWDKLPNQFVLKWNFCNGFNIICMDKEKLDIGKTKEQLKMWGKSRKHLLYSELQYRTGKERKIVCEQFIKTTNGNSLEDYKVYCFNGKAEYVMVCCGRETGNPKFYYFDKEWNLMNFSRDALLVSEDFFLPKPNRLEDLFNYASIISKPFPFVRADFYIEYDKIIFGELTFTPSGGFDTKRLRETDLLFGRKINLPMENKLCAK